ncbi:MAG TPA: hypothetical protein DEF00_04190 [Candidatus Taylorbacteria bacterium]|nr:hypothetical protein [Candidatus Taylorbacteria bacterium]
MLISEGYIDFESSRGILIPREMMYGKYNCFVEVDIIDLFEVRWQSYAQMKTKRTLLQWAGHSLGVILFVAVAAIPTGVNDHRQRRRHEHQPRRHELLMLPVVVD